MYQKKEMNAGLEEFRSTPGALLVDVRNPSEYNAGHIPGSVNFAMSRILKEARRNFPIRRSLSSSTARAAPAAAGAQSFWI